jgi:hypothetical protein
MNSNTDQFRLISQTYYRIARKMARSLFENDPRIGLYLITQFPDCPLFDPPYIENTYRFYLTQVEAMMSRADLDARKNLQTCPFCQGPMFCIGLPHVHTAAEGGIWCGGTVGFAHPSCAPWVAAQPRQGTHH